MRGKPDNNPWGPAVTMFRTANGTPLYFNFHVTPLEERSIGKRPLGHMLLTGTSGEGKTTLLDFLLCQCMKFNPRMFCYDRDRGMEPFIRSVGGYYKVLQQGVKLTSHRSNRKAHRVILQPLKILCVSVLKLQITAR